MLEKRNDNKVSKKEKDSILMGLKDIRNGRVFDFNAVCQKLEAECVDAMLQSSNIKEG